MSPFLPRFYGPNVSGKLRASPVDVVAPLHVMAGRQLERSCSAEIRIPDFSLLTHLFMGCAMICRRNSSTLA